MFVIRVKGNRIHRWLRIHHFKGTTVTTNESIPVITEAANYPVGIWSQFAHPINVPLFWRVPIRRNTGARPRLAIT